MRAVDEGSIGWIPRHGTRQAFHHCRWTCPRFVSIRVPGSRRRPLVRHDAAALPGSRRRRNDRRHPPPVLISGVRSAACRELVSALGAAQDGFSDLRARQNQLQIDFIGLASAPATRSDISTACTPRMPIGARRAGQRTVTYANLAPGRYTFVGPGGQLGRDRQFTPCLDTLRDSPPVWQRAWFMVLAALVSGLMVYALYRYRVARVLDMANLRTRIATDLHDDIGANLTRIALAQRGGDAEARRPSTRRCPGRGERTRCWSPKGGRAARSIARIARESVSSMSDIVWAINPARETLLDLTRRMRQHADELFTLRDIELRFDAPDAAGNCDWASTFDAIVLLIFKESVNNAARHSRCAPRGDRFSRRGISAALAITDNGTGFDPTVDARRQRSPQHAAARSDAEWDRSIISIASSRVHGTDAHGPVVIRRSCASVARRPYPR